MNGLSTCNPLFLLPLPPVYSIKPSSQPPIQAGDDEKNQRTITVNSAHMGKAFKAMNELRRYFSYFARVLLEETCSVNVIRSWDWKSELYCLIWLFYLYSQSLSFLFYFILFWFWSTSFCTLGLLLVLCSSVRVLSLVYNMRVKCL